jgi:LysM repeat protein
MPTHNVAQGDTLISIAHQYGFTDWQKIWDDPQNAELRKTRSNPMVLYPGDKVFVPEKEVRIFERRTAATHTFRMRRLTCTFSVYLKDECDKPYAGCKYELKVGQDTFTGQVASDGLVIHEVKPDSKTGQLKLWPDPADPKEVYTWEIKVGHLDPIETVSGVQARLNNLGFRAGPVDGKLNATTKEAIEAFQLRIGYQVPTGEIDDRTRKALLAAHNGL